MKLTIKSLQGGNFTLEAEPTDTIGSIKSKISSEKGHAVEQQKIIHSGKILTDDQTVQACNVTEKGFLVLMVSKPKAPKTEAPAAASSSTPAASATASEAPKAAAEAPSSATAPAASSEPSAAAQPTSAQPSSTGPSTGGDSSFATGSQLESVIQNMMEMGFQRDEIQRALRASYNNPDRAVEYLMNGIPEHLLREQQQQQTPQARAPSSGGGAATAQAAAPAAPAPAPAPAGNLFDAAAAAAQQPGGARGGAGAAAGGGAGGRGLESLFGDAGATEDDDGTVALDLGDPQMLQQLRSLIDENPAALQPLVQAIAQSNPSLAQSLAENPHAVLNLLSGLSGQGGEGLLPEGEEEELQLPRFEDLAAEDRTAIEQIQAMGIPQEKAIEAYMMCGRNVEMAVQYYFEHESEFQD